MNMDGFREELLTKEDLEMYTDFDYSRKYSAKGTIEISAGCDDVWYDLSGAHAANVVRQDEQDRWTCKYCGHMYTNDRLVCWDGVRGCQSPRPKSQALQRPCKQPRAFGGNTCGMYRKNGELRFVTL